MLDLVKIFWNTESCRPTDTRNAHTSSSVIRENCLSYNHSSLAQDANWTYVHKTFRRRPECPVSTGLENFFSQL